MSDQEYDLFLSHASEDTAWCETLAERLRNESVRVWFDQWELQPGDNLIARINDGIKGSRKMVAVFSKSYFKDQKVWTRAESYAQQSPDILSKDRPLIPLLIEDCEIEPTLRGILFLDFRNRDDFDLRLRQLIEALDLPRREFAREEEIEFREHKLDPAERGRRNYAKGKRFEDEVAALYRLLGFEVKNDLQLSGFQIDLMIEQEVGGIPITAIVECKDKRVTSEERDQILAQQYKRSQKLPSYRCIAVSSQGFAADTRTALEESGVHCTTYQELLRKLVPLDNYVDGLIAEYEKEAERKWNGEDWFIRPEMVTDITFERLPALQHFGKWLGDERRNQLVILGDLGTGKTTLAGFLAYNLARSFRGDPLRHPAPVLIPLKDVRKEISLESIVISHFSRRGLRDINFVRFEHLVRLGKVVLFFDAFDEMADRVRWDDTQSNFRELSRAAELQGKVIITCRTHYFKDRTEQVKAIGQGPSLSEVETELYRELRQRSNAEVVYLQEFNDGQIQEYLKKARPKDHSKDWRKIQEIYNLKDLATRPLLLDMIVKSLPRLKPGQEVNAANLYKVYTEIWIDREEEKGRKFRLDRNLKLALMLELAWRMWRDEKQAIHYRELASFVANTVAAGKIEIGDEETTDIANEMQGASFLKRDDSGNFCFMHRSFGEFFVARKLQDSFADPAALRDLLNTRRYDRKTIFFLTKLDENDGMREPLRQILTGSYQPNVSENALQLLYWSARIRAGLEEEIEDPKKLRDVLTGRIPAGAKLSGAHLQEITLECADLTEADLTDADLSKANLNHARLLSARLTGATLEDAQLQQAEAAGADFRKARLRGASCLGTIFVDADFTDADYGAESFKDASLRGTRGLAGVSSAVDAARLRPVVQSGTNSAVNAVAYSFDGALVAGGGDDGVILIYRVEDGVLLRTLESNGGASINAVAFSPDGELLASGSDDHSVKLWQVKSGKLIRSLEGHSHFVNAVAFSPDGELLASGSDDHLVKFWQVKSGNLIRSLEGHSSAVLSIAFSPDGELLASGSYDKSVKLWDVKLGKLLRLIDGHSFQVRSVAFAPDGKILASGSDDNLIKLWEVKSGKPLCSLEGHNSFVSSVAFAPDGKMLASGSSDKSVKLWKVKSGKLILSLVRHSDYVLSVAFAPDGELLVSGSSDESVKLWQVKSGKLIRSLEGRSSPLLSVALAPHGGILASGGDDHSIKLWQIKSANPIRSLKGHSSAVLSITFAPNGELLASGSDDHSIKLWLVKSGKLIRLLQGQSSAVRSVAFAPDGEMLASGSDRNSVKLWQIKSGRMVHSLDRHSDSVWSVAFSPNGELLASGSFDTSVKLWEVSSGSLIHSLEGHSDYVLSVTFAPDGTMLASGSSDESVKVWEVKSKKPIHSLKGHSSFVSSVSFAPDGKMLASGSYDNSVKLWQMGSGKLIRTLIGHLGGVDAVVFAPNGRYLIAAGSAGRLQFWDVETGETFLYQYSFGPGAWLSILPDGRFDGTPEGMRYLGYTEIEGFAHYPAETMVKEFYSPEAVREVLEKYTK